MSLFPPHPHPTHTYSPKRSTQINVLYKAEISRGKSTEKAPRGLDQERRERQCKNHKRLCKPEVMSKANYDSCPLFKKKLSADETGQKLALKVINQSVASF